MKKNIRLLAILLAAIVSSCASNEHIIIDKAAPNAECEVGDTVEIALEENPTTGYVWRVNNDGFPVLNLESQAYQPRAASKNLAGSGGTIIYTFKAAKPGEAKVKLTRARPWENKPIDSAEFDITVQ